MPAASAQTRPTGPEVVTVLGQRLRVDVRALIDRAADFAPLIEKFLDEARPRRPRVEN